MRIGISRDLNYRIQVENLPQYRGSPHLAVVDFVAVKAQTIHKAQ
jgi:hypothetical protein